MRTGRWGFLLIVFLGTFLAYVARAWMVRSSISPLPAWLRTVLVQIAAFFASSVTPVGPGWVALNQSYLQHEGTDEGAARAATGLNMVLTVTSQIGLLAVLMPFLPSLQLPNIPQPPARLTLDIVCAAAVVLGVAFWIPASRRRILDSIRPVLRAVPLRAAGLALIRHDDRRRRRRQPRLHRGSGRIARRRGSRPGLRSQPPGGPCREGGSRRTGLPACFVLDAPADRRPPAPARPEEGVRESS